MTEAPKVYCPKEDREVPIWYCLGSFIQQRPVCPELLKATIDLSKDYAWVKCKAQKPKKKEEKEKELIGDNLGENEQNE